MSEVVIRTAKGPDLETLSVPLNKDDVVLDTQLLSSPTTNEYTLGVIIQTAQGEIALSYDDD